MLQMENIRDSQCGKMSQVLSPPTAARTSDAEPDKLTVQMPLDSLSERTMNRIRRIIENKGELFHHIRSICISL